MMVSGNFAAWYCISIFFKSTDMPSQILYRGPLLFLSNCFTRWECSNRFSYSLQVTQTKSTGKNKKSLKRSSLITITSATCFFLLSNPATIPLIPHVDHSTSVIWSERSRVSPLGHVLCTSLHSPRSFCPDSTCLSSGLHICPHSKNTSYTNWNWNTQ